MGKIPIEELIQELSWYMEGKIPTMQLEHVLEILKILEKHRETCMWISVSDRLPPEHDIIFAKLKGTKQWNPNMFMKSSDDVRVVVKFEDGTRMVSHDHTVDGKWHCEMEKCAYPKRTVTHWCENPELAEEEA